LKLTLPLYRFQQINLKMVCAMLVVGLMAMFFGLLAVSANPIMIGLGMGIVFGPLLLLLPELTIWLILVIGLLLGILSASPQFGKVTWIVSILSMLLLLPSLINMLWSKHRQMPGFMLIALIFLFYSVTVSIIQWHSLGEFIAGFKRYFQTFGLMLALTMIAFSDQSYVRWRRFLMVVALLQFPFALYELLVLVPKRASSMSDATDIIAGTFGANLQGGSPNSVMVIYLFIALAFLVARWRAGLIDSKIFYAFAFICLLPLGMGETKIAVVMLPLVGLVLVRKDLIMSPIRYLPSILVIALLTSLLGYLYVTVMMKSSLSEVIEASMRYNIGNQGYSQKQILNRMTSFTFWFQQQSWDNPLSFLLGNGLGSSYTSAGAMSGHLGLKFQHFGINLTAVSTVLWDTGLFGFFLLSSIFIAAWFAADRLGNSVSDPGVKADALAIQAAIALFALSLIYSDSIVNLVSMELIYAIVLGYLGYLLNRHGLVGKRADGPLVKSHA